MAAILHRILGKLWSFLGAQAVWHSSWDVKLLILLRMVRLLGFGGTTFILALHLHVLGFGDWEVGLFMTLTLLGDLFISFALTYVGDNMGVRLTVALGGLLMCVGSAAFVFVDNFWLLLLASIVGVINPSANEIDPFKAIEESAISRLSGPETCSDVFAWWTMLGMFGTALSNLLTGLFLNFMHKQDFRVVSSYRFVFLGYGIIGLVKLLGCFLLSSDVELGRPRKEGSAGASSDGGEQTNNAEEETENTPLLAGGNGTQGNLTTCPPEVQETGTEAETLLAPARGQRLFSPTSTAFMWRVSLALVFDFIGSGLAQISWMTYFFKSEYDVDEAWLGSAIFAAGIVSSLLNLTSPPLARAIGPVQTMVVCHTINSVSLLVVSVPANMSLALAIFIFRIVTRELDNAPRQAFIAGGVRYEERTSAMGVVNIVKTIGSCLGLFLTGVFADIHQFWLAFVIAGSLKLVYNILIAAFFWRRSE